MEIVITYPEIKKRLLLERNEGIELTEFKKN